MRARLSTLLPFFSLVSLSKSFPTFVLPTRGTSQLFAENVYLWDLQGDGDMVSDLLLEMGALSTQVVVAEEGIAITADFDRTGRLQTDSNKVTFSALDDASAQRLVQGVSELMDLNPTDAWNACCKQEIPDMVMEEIAIPPPSNYVLRVGGQQLLLTNGDEETWAFGDGNHPSTQVSILALETHLSPGKSVLDYGCGSGILSLAAIALGASKITSVDISDDALELTRLNCKSNFPDSDANIEILHSDDYTTEKFDVVVANIPANTLVRLLPVLSQSLGEDGVMLLSGYPTIEGEVVAQAANQHELAVYDHFYDSGWVLQALSRRRQLDS
jgi:ribosomal protein L11 methylase PrmA